MLAMARVLSLSLLAADLVAAASHAFGAEVKIGVGSEPTTFDPQIVSRKSAASPTRADHSSALTLPFSGFTAPIDPSGMSSLNPSLTVERYHAI